MSDIQGNDRRRERLNRVLLGVVIFLGVLIVAAFLALVYGALSTYGKHRTAPPVETSGAGVTLQSLPRGAKILDMKVDGGKTIVRLRTDKGDEIEIFDTASGRLLTRIAPQAP